MWQDVGIVAKVSTGTGKICILACSYYLLFLFLFLTIIIITIVLYCNYYYYCIVLYCYCYHSIKIELMLIARISKKLLFYPIVYFILVWDGLLGSEVDEQILHTLFNIGKS